jgi:hypothetical protein
VIHHGQGSKPPAIEQRIRHKIHPPAFVELAGTGWENPQLTGPFLSPPQSDREAFFAIDPVDALLVHHPALSPQQHMDALKAKPRPRLRQFTDTSSNRTIIPRMRPIIPTRSIEAQ